MLVHKRLVLTCIFIGLINSSVTAAAPDYSATIRNIAVVSATTTFTVRVCNSGSSSGPSVAVGLTYDAASVVACSATADIVQFTNTLAIGACEDIDFVAQNTAIGLGRRTAWVDADYDCAQPDPNRGNNVSSSAYDMAVEFHVLSSALTILTNGDLQVFAWTVNGGAGQSGDVTYGIYHQDSQPTCNDTPFTTFTAPAGFMNKTISNALPTQSGNHTIWAMINAGCPLYETVINNNSFSTTFQLGPSLSFESSTVTDSAGTTTYSARVCNTGNQGSGSFNVAIYKHRTQAPQACNEPSPPDFTLPVADLQPNACTDISATSSTTSPGNYSAYFVIDPECAVAEADETDNVKLHQYTILAPDLSIENLEVSFSGNTATFAIRVCNRGNFTSSDIQLILFADAAAAPTCSQPPGSGKLHTISGGMASGACDTISIAQPGIQDGNFVARAAVDMPACFFAEINETNNHRALQYSFSNSQPDLLIESTDVTVSEDDVTYTVKICNRGRVNSLSFGWGLNYSDSGHEFCNDSLDYAATIAALGSGSCVTVSHTQNNADPGFRTAVFVLDNECSVTEYNETNNTAKKAYQVGNPKMPDLFIQSFEATSSEDRVEYAIQVCNRGVAASPFQVGLYYDRSTAPDENCGDVPDKSGAVGLLAANTCAAVSVTRLNAATGSYLAWAMADSTCQRDELNEDNNTASAPYSVTGRSGSADGGLPNLDGSIDQGASDDSSIGLDATTNSDTGGGAKADGTAGDAGKWSCRVRLRGRKRPNGYKPCSLAAYPSFPPTPSVTPLV